MLSCESTEDAAEKNTDDLQKAPQGVTTLLSSALRDYYRTITDSCTSTSPNPILHGQQISGVGLSVQVFLLPAVLLKSLTYIWPAAHTHKGKTEETEKC